MASGEGVPRALSPTAGPDDSFPAAPPSIISSRMTDIMSDDGGDTEAHRAHGAHRRSAFYSDLSSRPGTARTAMSQRSPWTQGAPLRRGLSGKRGSVGSSSTAPRPGSSTTRSHVPSLTSHAFFRPMSSQKLQAQRGIARPTTMNRQFVSQDEVHDPNRNSVASGTGAQLVRESVEEAEMRGPPSRGTEFTELDTIDRRTANTSPVHGHQASSSLTDSVRPLQRKPADGRQLTLDMSKTYKTDANVPTPVRTPRSLGSAFLMPRGDSGGSNREMEGGEKLDSVASSPKLPPKGHGGEMSSKMEKTKQKAGHNYEYFQGNTVFCIGGRLQNTRHKPVNIATGSLVVIPGILFFIFSASWLWHNVSPAVPITFGYLYYICVSSFLHASASDPGILPRNLHRFPPPEENDDPWRPGPPTTEWTLIKSAERSTAAMEVPTKYCRTCQIWRPPRAHHCRLCDNCVETQDHHCVWLNNCVGRRNYRYFFTFISSATFLGLYLAGASLAQVLLYMHRTEGVSFGDSISKFRVPFAMVIYGFLAFLYPAALMGYHVFLMARGETTREYLNSHKFLKKDRYKAFTQGSWFKNWFVVLCRPRPPTYYGFKKSFTQGDQRFGSTRREKGSSGGGGSPHQPAKNAEGGGIETKEGMEMQNVKPSPQPQQQSPQQPETGFQGPRSLMRFSTGLGMSGAPEARGNT